MGYSRNSERKTRKSVLKLESVSVVSFLDYRYFFATVVELSFSTRDEISVLIRSLMLATKLG